MLCSRFAPLVAAFALFGGWAAADETVHLGRANWSGVAVSDQSKFQHCEATTVLQAGTKMGLRHDRDKTWLLSLSNEKWRLPTGRVYDLRLAFDQFPGLSAKGSAVSASRLDIALEKDATLLALLRRGRSLHVTSGTFDERYSLEGTATIVPSLRLCVLTRLQAEELTTRRSELITKVAATVGTALVWSTPNARLLYSVGAVLEAASRSSGQPTWKVSVGTVEVLTSAPPPQTIPVTRRTADAAREAQKSWPDASDLPAPSQPLKDLPDVSTAFNGEQIGPFFLPASMPTVIALTGEIYAGTTVMFRRAQRARPEADTMILDSVGGLVNEGLLLSYEVYERDLTTFVPYDAECLSACAFVFFAGSTRVADGKLGVHQIYGEGVSPSDAQDVLSDVLPALHDYGVPQEVITLMLRTRPEQMHVFTREEVQTLGLNRGMLDRETLFQQIPNAPITVVRGRERIGGASVSGFSAGPPLDLGL